MKEHAGEGRGGLIAGEATTKAFCLTEAAAAAAAQAINTMEVVSLLH